MSVGLAITIAFAAVSTAILLFTFYLIRKTYRMKMDQAASVLGIGRQMAYELERTGELPGALALGHPVAISAKALEVFLHCKTRSLSEDSFLETKTAT